MNQLNDSQLKAFDYVDRGFNCFLTGGAGVGKSFLLRFLKKKFPTLTITASTGIAALNVGGNTVHSVFLPNLYHDIGHIVTLLKKTKKIETIQNLEMLAIDEISMLDGRILTQIDEILKRVKEQRNKPFGGVQLIAIGDFLQLPPVPSSDKNNSEKRITYAFESPAWSFKTINLTQIERQSDADFMHLLRHLRQGYKSDNFYTLLKNRHCDDKTLDKSIIRLYPMTARCDKYNNACQEALEAEEQNYKGVYFLKENTEVEQKINDKILKSLIKSSKSKENLKFKIGDRVMLTFNIDIDSNLVNGVCGKVIGFTEKNEAVESSWELIRRNNKNDNPSGYMKNIFNYLESWKEKNHNHYPVIRFDNGITKIITPVVWRDVTVINKNEIENAVYCQLPLMLAFSITIHKAQGMSLDNACVYFSGCIQYGQYYVAMSRLKSLQGLYIPPSNKGIKTYNDFFIKADPKVLAFYKSTLT